MQPYSQQYWIRHCTSKSKNSTCSTSSESFTHEYSVPYQRSVLSVLPANFLPITDILHDKRSPFTITAGGINFTTTNQQCWSSNGRWCVQCTEWRLITIELTYLCSAISTSTSLTDLSLRLCKMPQQCLPLEKISTMPHNWSYNQNKSLLDATNKPWSCSL